MAVRIAKVNFNLMFRFILTRPLIAVDISIVKQLLRKHASIFACSRLLAKLRMTSRLRINRPAMF